MTAGGPLSADVALVRLAQYGERAKTWSSATYDSGAERALHEIATALAAEAERLRGALREACDEVAERDSEIGGLAADVASLRAQVAELERAALDDETQRHASAYRYLRDVIETVLADDDGPWDDDVAEEVIYGRYVQHLAARRAGAAAETTSGREWAVRVPADEDGPETVDVRRDEAEAHAALGRWRDSHPDAELVVRAVSHGPWTKAEDGAS